MTSEYGCTAERFAPDQWNPELYCEGDNCVVTPSVWSKNKLVEYGFPDQKVCVVPHGVCGEIFYPSGEAERTLVRTQLGLIDEHVAFLNVGALSWNKGLDYLVRAFVEIHQKYPIARLLLKDASSLYGMTTTTFFKEYTRLFGAIPREAWDAIRVVPSSQSLESMRQLYSAADCYVSPYRAEGFNLPVIEAIACGTPVIVSDGGATDDFCDLRTSLKVECDHVLNTDRDLDIPGTHLEPRIDSLVEQMRKVVSGEFCTNETFVDGWRDLRQAYSWNASVHKLVTLF